MATSHVLAGAWLVILETQYAYHEAVRDVHEVFALRARFDEIPERVDVPHRSPAYEIHTADLV